MEHCLKSSPLNQWPNAPSTWQSRVGKNSSFVEAVYHAALGIACVWSSSLLFRVVSAAYFLAMLILIGLGASPLFIAATSLAGGLAIGAVLMANAFARLIKLADQLRKASSN
jgi:hypothetical protein